MGRFLLLLALLGGARLAWADLVLVSGRGSPINQISQEQAEKLYLGRLSALPDGMVVHPVDLPTGPVRDQFYQKLTGKNPNQIRAYWSRMVFAGRAAPPREVESPAALSALLATHPDLVGYLQESEVDGRVRILLRIE